MEEIIKRLESKKQRLLAEDIPTFRRLAFSKVVGAFVDKVFPILFGLRRTGKTTILKQILKENSKEAIYISFMDSYISSLSDFELELLFEKLYDRGYRYFLLDEAQVYSSWSKHIVAAYESFSDLKIVVTGSSSLNLDNKETGLDRTRKIIVGTLSYGEYLVISNKAKSKETFEEFLGNFGFPYYAKNQIKNFDLQREEVYEDILNNDIPAKYKNISIPLISRLMNVVASKTNGEINMSDLVKKIAPNFLQRDALRYINILQKAKILKKVNRINSDLSLPKNEKFKLYINPHIHLWILNTPFNKLDDKMKGHIIESYWLTWMDGLSKYNKLFMYLKDTKTNKEIDFISLNNSTIGPELKTLHEFKYSTRKTWDLSFLKSFDSINKIIWNITGDDIDQVKGKSILDTFDKEI